MLLLFFVHVVNLSCYMFKIIKLRSQKFFEKKSFLSNNNNSMQILDSVSYDYFQTKRTADIKSYSNLFKLIS